MKDEILYLVSLFYGSKDEALKWYERPNSYFGKWNEKLSPQEMVDTGKGDEVLEWVQLAMSEK